MTEETQAAPAAAAVAVVAPAPASASPTAAPTAQPIAITVQLPPPAPPHWTAYATALGSPFVGVVAASIAGFIAYRQWVTARSKLKIDLFEKRMALYQRLMDVLNRIFDRTWQTESRDSYVEFLHISSEMSWIFNDQIMAFIENELSEKLKKYASASHSLADADGIDKTEVMKEFRTARRDVISFINESMSRMKELFGLDLKLNH